MTKNSRENNSRSRNFTNYNDYSQMFSIVEFCNLAS